MDPEGMVHALQEAHRLLRSDGLLIDIHPHPHPYRIEVIDDGEVLLSELSRPDVPDDDVVHAEVALTEAVNRGLYRRERGEEFEFITYGSSVPEFRDYWEEQGGYSDSAPDPEVMALRDRLYTQAAKMLRESGGRAQVAIRERCRISRFYPLAIEGAETRL